MRQDAAAYTPFQDHFRLDIITYRTAGWAADRAERALIEHHKATGPAGYNTLPSAPSKCRRYYAMAAARRAAKAQPPAPE